MKKLRYFIVLCLFLVLPAFLSAQTGQRIEELLRRDAVSYEQASQFVLEAADVRGSISQTEAFRYASDQKWLPGNASGGDDAELGGVALLIMKAFDLKGGMLYTLFQNPHYAYRELEYKSIIQGRTDPGMRVSGDFLLFTVGEVLSMTEGNYEN
jgi:hypothetical protein